MRRDKIKFRPKSYLEQFDIITVTVLLSGDRDLSRIITIGKLKWGN